MGRQDVVGASTAVLLSYGMRAATDINTASSKRSSRKDM